MLFSNTCDIKSIKNEVTKVSQNPKKVSTDHKNNNLYEYGSWNNILKKDFISFIVISNTSFQLTESFISRGFKKMNFAHFAACAKSAFLTCQTA